MRGFFEPDDKESFGYVLWLILGGKEADRDLVAKRLKVSVQTVTAYIHGRAKISQEKIKDGKWRKTFAKHYSENWKKYKGLFEERAATLEAKPAARKYPGPKDKSSFGYVLWLIIGGENANFSIAAEHLGLNSQRISEYIHGKKEPSQEYIEANKWRELLALHYPDGWKQYGNLFGRRFKNLPAKPRTAVPKEPEDKSGFGYALWLVLGGKKANMELAAERLAIAPRRLSALIHGKQKTSQKYIEDNGWRAIFERHYPKTWKKNRDFFESSVKKLAVKRGNRKSEPQDKEGFGYALWLVIGGEKANLAQAAERLKVDLPYLHGIIHGEESISRKSIEERGWRATFAVEYKNSWVAHGALFEQRAARLKAGKPAIIRGPSVIRRGAKRGPESSAPEDKTSFGCALWLILGGKKANLTEAAQRLKVSAMYLRLVINGEEEVSQKTVRDKEWRETLALHYKDGWQENGAFFDNRLLTQGSDSPIAKNWRAAAGEFVKKVSASRGDDAGELAAASTVPILTQEWVWQKIEAGASDLPASLFKSALNEICKIYHLKNTRPEQGLYATAQEIAAACG